MIKILALNSDNDGVGYFRILAPLSTLNDPEIDIEIRMLSDHTLPLLEESFLAQYNIITYNKLIPFNKPETEELFWSLIKKLGIKVIYDIDDNYILDPSHINYKSWKQQKSADKIETIIRTSDMVTTTTPIFAEQISKINKNVYVLENAINFDEQQWRYVRKPSDKIRFLWGGGISHMADLRLLKESFSMFDKDFLQKSQLYMCGFDLRVRTPQGILKDSSRRSQWGFFEDIFTNKGKWITNYKHREFLNQEDETNFGISEEFKDEFYQRRWTKPILLYGTMYNEADVCLAPLKNHNVFNKMKSQLKIIEAGAKHCPVITSNFGPYTVDDIEGKKDGKPKGFLIDEDKPTDWFKRMKWYSENPNAVKDHGENMWEYVKYNFDIDVVNQKRINLYKQIC